MNPVATDPTDPNALEIQPVAFEPLTIAPSAKPEAPADPATTLPSFTARPMFAESPVIPEMPAMAEADAIADTLEVAESPGVAEESVALEASVALETPDMAGPLTIAPSARPEAPADPATTLPSFTARPMFAESPVIPEMPAMAESAAIADALEVVEGPGVAEESVALEASVALETPDMAEDPTAEDLIAEDPSALAPPVAIAEPGAIDEDPDLVLEGAFSSPVIMEPSTAATPEDFVAEGLVMEALDLGDLGNLEPAITDPEEAVSDPVVMESMAADPLELEVLPVGIQVGDRPQTTGVLVRGAEDGLEAVALDTWLVPFDVVMQALQLQRTVLDNGEWELRSPGLVIRLDPDELVTDPDLGLAIAIADIEQRLGVPVSFEIANYALRLDPPWAGQFRRSQFADLPVITEGLPVVDSAPATVTTVAQRMDFFGRNGVNDSRGQFTALGGLGGGSWFFRMNQQDLFDSRTWNLSELQYLNQSDAADYAVGSQPTFWPSLSTTSNNQFWGVTTIQRFGYEPAFFSGSGGFNPSLRQQADVVGRTIVGEAPPNTLVQLVLNFRSNVIAETLVDSSGIYRFENIPARGGRYEVLLFPNGQLTAEPEVRPATFSTLPSRLAAGTSALVVSAGVGRVSRPNNFIGDFDTVMAGASYRYGVSDELTLGVGVVQDNALFGLGEIFYEPEGVPVRMAATVFGGGDRVAVDAAFTYEPSTTFRFDANIDPTTSRFLASWQAFPGLRLRLGGNSRENALIAGASFFHSTPNFNVNGSVDYTTNNNLRWSLLSRTGRAELRSFGNELSSNSELSFKLNEGRDFSQGHFLRLGYETQSAGGNNLTTVGWRYRSPARAIDGRYRWEMDVGYGLGSQGNGVVAALSTAIAPGLVLRARYEGVSVLTGQGSYRIELMPFVNTQAGVWSQDSRFDYLRQEGGLWIQPFIDRNGNGQRDEGEPLYLENAELLLVVNNRPLLPNQFEIQSNGIFLRLPPGTHRLDLDPAGFPIDGQPSQAAYAVEVTSGSYTPVPIPITRAFTVAGRVLDREGDPVAGARVEAIPQNGDPTRISVTNRAGIYYLEDLRPGTYQLRINGNSVQPNSVTLTDLSDGIQEINLRLSD